jgi:hypothetical protein
MAELKTKLTAQPVEEYLKLITDETTRNDCQIICRLMEQVTQAPAKMWGPSIIGVGNYRYRYESGRSNDWFMMGFSPRKAAISLYILGCDVTTTAYQDVLARLGKHTTGKSCIYIKRLSAINLAVLEELCTLSFQNLNKENF